MRAVRAVVPVWLAVCAIALIFGWTLQFFPGLVESAQFYPQTWAGNLAHYDPHAYLLIAQQGYGAEGRDFQSSVRFPLFPFLTRVGMQALNLDGYVAMFLLSKAALLVGLIGIWLLVAHWETPEFADRAVVYVAFPLLGSGYTWLMSYPEALHLALWTFSFWLLLRRHYYLAGLLTVLSVWTRPHAIVILPAFALVLVIETVRERGWRGVGAAAFWWRGLITCGLPLLAYAAWVLYISRLSAIPLSPLTAQGTYGRAELILPWIRAVDLLTLPFRRPLSQWGWDLLFNYYQLVLIILSLVILAVIAARRRLSWGLVAFSLLSLFPGLSTAIFAVGRYALLTWIPVALTYVVPKRFDAVVLPIGVALTVLTLVAINLVRSLQL